VGRHRRPDKHAAQLRKYIDADIDEVYVQQIGPDMDGFSRRGSRACYLSCAAAEAQSKSVPLVSCSHFVISPARRSAT